MGEEAVVSEKLEPVGNGKVEVDEKADVKGKTESVKDKKEEQPDGVTGMEEDRQDEVKIEAQPMDTDREEANGEKAEGEKVAEEVIEKMKKQEGPEADDEKQETVKDDGRKEEVKDEKMEEEAEEDTTKVTGEKVEEDDGSKDEEDKPEVLKEEKGSKKRPRSKPGSRRREKTAKKETVEVEKLPEKVEEPKTPAQKKTKEPKTTVEKKENELNTPSAFALERPVRERKSVERLVATIEKDASKDFHIEKGRGTALKDIPNVAYKLSRKKTEETFKLLHTILFGRRGKAAQVKNNISRFSGFVWHDNEEKQMSRVKEKLDKCVKEKLIEFCDVLDVPISKASAKKEDIIAKLIEFFMEPHATTSDLLAEKEQGTKRKRTSKSVSGSSTPSKGSAKSRKKVERDSKMHDKAKSTSPESEEDKGEDANGAQEGSEEISDHAASEEKGSESEESDEDKGKKKAGSAKSSVKKGSSEKAKTKKEIKKVAVSKKASPPPKKLPTKSPDCSKSNNDSSAKKSSVKKKDEALKKSSVPKKSTSNDSPGKRVLKVKQKPKDETLEPSDDDLRNSICKILKEVDFNTATFTDILKLLAKEFSTDLAAKKSTVKLMIQEELTKLADADEEDEGDTEKDGKAPNVGVKAT